MTIRVLIADDHHLFREGLARVLSDHADLQVLPSVSRGEDAVAAVVELAPDVVLMDVNMPGMGGVEAARQVRQRFPGTQVIMLTVSEQENDLFNAIRAGAHGYLLKNASSDELFGAIHRVYQGEAMIAPGMAVKLLDEFAGVSNPSASHEPSPAAGQAALSEREQQVLQLVAAGLSNKEIGLKLSLSPHTIKAHLRSILDKLHLRSRSEAAAWAARRGLTGGSGEPPG